MPRPPLGAAGYSREDRHSLPPDRQVRSPTSRQVRSPTSEPESSQRPSRISRVESARPGGLLYPIRVPACVRALGHTATASESRQTPRHRSGPQRERREAQPRGPAPPPSRRGLDRPKGTGRPPALRDAQFRRSQEGRHGVPFGLLGSAVRVAGACRRRFRTSEGTAVWRVQYPHCSAVACLDDLRPHCGSAVAGPERGGGDGTGPGARASKRPPIPQTGRGSGSWAGARGGGGPLSGAGGRSRAGVSGGVRTGPSAGGRRAPPPFFCRAKNGRAKNGHVPFARRPGPGGEGGGPGGGGAPSRHAGPGGRHLPARLAAPTRPGWVRGPNARPIFQLGPAPATEARGPVRRHARRGTVTHSEAQPRLTTGTRPGSEPGPRPGPMRARGGGPLSAVVSSRIVAAAVGGAGRICGPTRTMGGRLRAGTPARPSWACRSAMAASAGRAPPTAEGRTAADPSSGNGAPRAVRSKSLHAALRT